MKCAFIVKFNFIFQTYSANTFATFFKVIVCDTENKMMVPYYSNVSIINFEQVNAGWVLAKIGAYGFEID